MKRILAVVLTIVLAAVPVACNHMQSVAKDLPTEEVREAFAGVRIIAHRGLCTTTVDGQPVTVGENTIASFANAAKTAGWGIETDVWETTDGTLVCMHDPDALEGIDNVHLVDSQVALSTPLKKAPGYYAPTFADYLQICHDGNKAAVVEIKDAEMSEAGLDAVLAAIRAYEVQAIIVSFHYDKLAYIRQVDAAIPCQLLMNSNWAKVYRQDVGQRIGLDAYLQQAIDHRFSLSVEYKYLYRRTRSGADWVERFHQADLDVGIWTVDDVYVAIYHAAMLGVDYITTNIDMVEALSAIGI